MKFKPRTFLKLRTYDLKLFRIFPDMKIEQLTFTRFLAAVLIIIYHFGRNAFPFNLEPISFVFAHAYIGVSYFFILSGFIMIIAYGKHSSINTPAFFRNRFVRIYPVYFIALVLMFIYTIYLNGSISYKEILLNLFTLQAWVPGEARTINGPAWTICAEFFFYAIFPLLFNRIYSRYTFKQLIIPVLLIWLASQLIFHWIYYSDIYSGYPSRIHDFSYYFPLMHLSTFLIGNLAGLFFLRNYEKYQGNYDWLILVLFSLILFTLKNPIDLNFHNGLLAVLFVPLILLIALNKGFLTRISKREIFVFLGDISFGIYILQFPMFIVAGRILKELKIEDSVIVFYFSFAFLLMVSIASYLFVEKPLREKYRVRST